ncbi:MAG TPA: chemotaxis response regulator protein-glutamate methylesterase [Vicinamibacterales bacterium]|jgi:two-component system chemotaxis response regulator CheB|nr:chemotaxis response regulator protein-glutamate methylesterase [Vicinamibacterales bacterium]
MNVSAPSRPLNVLVVDDSAVMRQVMTTVLSREGLNVDTAAHPLIASSKLKQRKPDVIVLDIEMPHVDGLTFLQQIMADEPIPVVVCSALATGGAETVMRALEYGAVDVVQKPAVGIQDFLYEQAVMLVDKVRGAAMARPRRRTAPSHPDRRLSADAVLPVRRSSLSVTTDKVVAVGTSTGGTEALRILLTALPLDAPGFVVVQHMPELFTAGFAQRLNQMCQVDVKEAADGDRVQPGRVLIAPGNRHTIIVRNGAQYAVKVMDGPLVSRHRPSVDVLFRSVAQAAGANAVGVLMTGMGDDGAEGLLEMKRAGAATIAQDEATCVVFGMPRAAIDRGAVDDVLPLTRIAQAILARAGVA